MAARSRLRVLLLHGTTPGFRREGSEHAEAPRGAAVVEQWVSLTGPPHPGKGHAAEQAAAVPLVLAQDQRIGEWRVVRTELLDGSGTAVAESDCRRADRFSATVLRAGLRTARARSARG